MGSGGRGSGGTSGSGGTAGSAGTGGSGGSGGSQSGGTSGTGGVGTGGGAVIDAGSGGASDGGVDSAGGTNGGKACAGNAISLSSNGTDKASDAAQAKVVINLMGDLPVSNDKRTVEFWAYIKPTDWVGENNQVFFYGSSGSNRTFGLDFGTSAVAGMANNHATLDPFAAFSDDNTNYLGISSAMAQWVHVAMTWDGTAVKTYVNGALRITSMRAGTPATLATASSSLMLGCNPTNMFCFNGMFDEVRVWKVARTDAEIMANYAKPLAGNEAGLMGYWKFDEAPGSANAADSVTTAGHTAHPGMLMATNTNELPTFVTPTPPVPLVCP